MEIISTETAAEKFARIDLWEKQEGLLSHLNDDERGMLRRLPQQSESSAKASGVIEAGGDCLDLLDEQLTEFG